MFKAIANMGSQATSVQEAEKYSLKYFWYFMLVTAFVFTGLTEGAESIYRQSINISDGTFSANVEDEFSILLRNLADNTPLKTAATWINWIIVRCVVFERVSLHYIICSYPLQLNRSGTNNSKYDRHMKNFIHALHISNFLKFY